MKINIFEFQVMIQPHNRQMSFSLYISALAVSDTVVLIMGKIVLNVICTHRHGDTNVKLSIVDSFSLMLLFSIF